MKAKGRRGDYVPQGGSVKGRETTRDERMQIITLREKARMTWKVGMLITATCGRNK